MASTRFSKIVWGDGLAVSDQGDDTIRVDGIGGATGPAGATGPEGPEGPPGADGADGAPGVGVPAGGTDGQVLTKASGTDYDTDWETPTGGGGPLDLDDLTDVQVPSPADGDVLMWDAGASLWGPRSVHVPKQLVASWAGTLPTVAADGLVWPVPYVEGASMTFDLTRAKARVEVPGAGSTVLTLAKSSGGGAFSPTTITALTVAAADYEEENTSLSGTVSSGDLVRLSFTTLGTTGVYSVELQGEET